MRVAITRCRSGQPASIFGDTPSSSGRRSVGQSIDREPLRLGDLQTIGASQGETPFALGAGGIDDDMVVLAFVATMINAQDTLDDLPRHRDLLLDLPEKRLFGALALFDTAAGQIPIIKIGVTDERNVIVPIQQYSPDTDRAWFRHPPDRARDLSNQAVMQGHLALLLGRRRCPPDGNPGSDRLGRHVWTDIQRRISPMADVATR